MSSRSWFALASLLVAALPGISAFAGCSSPPVPDVGAGALPPAPSRSLRVPDTPIRPDDDYRIGPSDALSIRIYELERPRETTVLEVEVSREGRIFLPPIGEVEAAERTAPGLRAELRTRLAERFLVDPQVQVAVTAHRSRKIAVTGAVRSPGTFAIPRNRVTVLETLSLAGGLSDRAGERATIHRRKAAEAPPQVEVDLERLLDRGDLSLDLSIEPGDVLHVHEAERFFVLGYVHRPGEYWLRRKTTAFEAVAMAGGTVPRAASPAAAYIRRQRPGGGPEIIPIDLSDVADGEGPDVDLLPGDVVVVPQTALRSVGVEVWGFFKGILP